MSNPTITAVTEIDESRYKTKIFSGGHLVYADEPTNLGGTDEGMTPGALLLASLGSCTAITLRMYADRKKWDLTGVTIHLAICEEDEMSKETKITRKIEFTGELNDNQRQRLMVIADKCPVHKILSNPIQVISS